MASTRPPDKVLKNPLLTSADQNAFFEEFAHSRLLVAPPAPHPVSTPGSGHVSSVCQDTVAAEIRDPTTPNPQVQESDKDPTSDQTFTEIPLTPGSNVSALPSQTISSSAPPPVGPPPTSGPPPSTGFIRSAPLSRYIPSNFIQTSLPTPAPLQIFQGAPSAPVGVSLLNPTQIEKSDETAAASTGNPVPETSVLNDRRDSVIAEAPSQKLTPVSQTPTSHSVAPPPNFPVSSFAVYSQPPTQPVNVNPSVSSPPSITTPAFNVPLIPKSTSIPGFPASSNFANNTSSSTVPSSKSTDFPFVPVFPKPNSGNFLPNYPINIVNENAITTGLVPPQLRSSPSPLSSKHSTPPPGSQTPLLLSAERGSPSISQIPHNSGSVDPSQLPVVARSPQTAPPIKPGSPAQVGPPLQVGPPPRGNSSPYPSALSRSAVGRTGLGQHSSSSLRQTTIPKASPEQQVQFFTPAPVENVFPPTFGQPQSESFISPSNQQTETEKPKSFLSSAASYFNLSGDSDGAQQSPLSAQNDSGFYQSLNQPSLPPSSLSYSGPGTSYPTSTPQLGPTFPQTVPTSSTSSYFQPAPTSQSSHNFFQDSSTSGNPSTFFAPPPVASVPPIQAVQPLQNQSRPSSVGSVSSLQSAGSFPPVTSSTFSSTSQKPFTHPPPSSYFTPISEPNNQQSPSPVRSVTSSQGSQPPYTNPSLPESTNQPLSFYNPNNFATPTSQAFNPQTSAYPPKPTSPPQTTDHISKDDPISVAATSTPVTAPSVNSNVSANFSTFSGGVPQQNFVSASSFFQSAPSSTQPSASDSFLVSPQHQQTIEETSSPPTQLTSSERITPSNTPPPTYGSLDTRDIISNPNCNVDDSAHSEADGRSIEPTSNGQTQYCGPRPTSLPPVASQGNTYRRTSLKRPSYAPVPDLGVSLQPTELMGQSQHLSGSMETSGTMQDEPPPVPTSEGDRAHSGSPQSPNMSMDQSMDFSGQSASTGGHYRPAFHHWFFKKDTKRAEWLPFSMADSLNIEQAFVSPDVSEATKVPTDGGRYDVEVLLRKKTAVYWEESPSEVRRCSWFVKSPVGARFVPYDENIAEFLEEEYKQGCLTNEWNRRIELADGEVIILHSPNTIAHHQRSSSPDNWGNPPAMQQKPRIVKRGLEDFEISEGEPTQVDHLLLVVHGIGKVCDLRFRSLVEVVDDFRSVSLQLVQSHFRRASESGQVGRVEVLPVEWHQASTQKPSTRGWPTLRCPVFPKPGNSLMTLSSTFFSTRAQCFQRK
uniref:SEC23-interacting protein n=1 Tax=Lygus hesperus TaxID=30085 RepID=A0A0A9WDL1_LYGHE